MTNRKNTSRALVASALAVLLCVSMLVGSTFAWFTDNATTQVSNIVSGTLKIGLYSDAECTPANTLEEKTLTFKKADGAPEGEAVLFEPGATYELTPVYLKNEGNLHAKYKIVINGIDGESKLAEVLDVIVTKDDVETNLGTLMNLVVKGDSIGVERHIKPNEIHTFGTIALKMQETANNDYQGKTIEGIGITVYATQDTVEYDSEDNQYDEKAEYDIPDEWDGTTGEPGDGNPEEGNPGEGTPDEEVTHITEIDSAQEFAAFAKTINVDKLDYTGMTVELNKSIDLNNQAWTPISKFAGTFDGNGHTIYNLKDAALFGTVAEGGVVKALNLNTVSANKVIGGFLANTVNGTVESCTVKNATVTSTTYGSSGLVGFAGVTAVIDKCSVDNFTLTVTNTGDNRDKVGGLVGQSSGATITNSSVSNITLNGVYKTKEWGGFVGRHANNGTIEGCTATNVKINVSDYAQSVGGFVGAPANATIKNCDVNGVTIKVNNCGWVGGFAGYIGDASYYDFDDCNVTGMSITLETDAVSGIGGFCGRAAYTLTIKNCSVEGTIDASDAAIATGKIKALVGYDRVDQYPDIMVTENNTTNVTIQ